MNQKSDTLFFFIMIMAMTLWGGSWISGKLVASSAHQDLLLVWRFLFCVIGFLAMRIFIPYSFKVPRGAIPLLLAAGIIMSLYNLFFFLGVRHGLAHKGGVIVTTLNPVFTFLIAATIFRTPVLRIQIIGIFLGIVGGLLLVEPWKYGLETMISSGNLFFLGAALAWAVLTHVAGRIMQRGVGLFTYNIYLYLGSFFFSLFLALDNAPLDFSQYSTGFWINIIYLSVFSASIGATLYFLATKRLGAGRAASFTLLVPAIAVIISWLVLGEVPSVLTLIGGGLALCAVYIINLGRRKIIAH